MRFAAMMLALGAVVGLSTPALAQQGPSRSVDDYLCTFAGKCDGSAKQAGADDSIVAPDTKGMSLARRKSSGDSSASAPSPSRSPAPAVTSSAPTRSTASSSARRSDRVASSAPARATPKATRGKRMDLRLEFDLDSAELTASAKEEAKVFARALLTQELSGKRFVIEGHTDSLGSRAYNMDLSRRRAAAVADYLSSLGVPRNRFEIRGYGPDQPLDGRSASSPENRRVEAVLL